MSDLVEKAARAIFASRHTEWYCEQYQEDWKRWTDAARAVVALVGEECATEIDKYRKEYGGNWPALEKLAERIRNLTDTGGRVD